MKNTKMLFFEFQLKSRSLTHLDQLEPQIRTEDDTISNASNLKGKQKVRDLKCI